MNVYGGCLSNTRMLMLLLLLYAACLPNDDNGGEKKIAARGKERHNENEERIRASSFHFTCSHNAIVTCIKGKLDIIKCTQHVVDD